MIRDEDTAIADWMQTEVGGASFGTAAPDVSTGGKTRIPERQNGLNRRAFAKTTGVGSRMRPAPVSNA
jgi:hypothetical protein